MIYDEDYIALATTVDQLIYILSTEVKIILYKCKELLEA